MKAAELEALVIAQGATIEGLQAKLQAQIEAHMHLVQRADNIVEGFKKELADRDERVSEMRTHQDGMPHWVISMAETLTARVEVLEKLVMARNSSAAIKRNMTDEDALRVLTGDLKDLPHKDAAEKIGLTYAQVYSCRLEFTFKHVHKTLRDASTPEAPWSNPWSK